MPKKPENCGSPAPKPRKLRIPIGPVSVFARRNRPRKGTASPPAKSANRSSAKSSFSSSFRDWQKLLSTSFSSKNRAVPLKTRPKMGRCPGMDGFCSVFGGTNPVLSSALAGTSPGDAPQRSVPAFLQARFPFSGWIFEGSQKETISFFETQPYGLQVLL